MIRINKGVSTIPTLHRARHGIFGVFFPSSFFLMCVSVSVSMYVCVLVCVYVCMYVSLYVFFFKAGSHCTWTLLIWLDWLGANLKDPLFPPLRRWRQHRNWDDKHKNSGSPACKTSPLLSYHSNPLVLFSMKIQEVGCTRFYCKVYTTLLQCTQ